MAGREVGACLGEQGQPLDGASLGRDVAQEVDRQTDASVGVFVFFFVSPCAIMASNKEFDISISLF